MKEWQRSIGVKLTALIATLALVVVLGLTAWIMHVQLQAAEASLERKTIAYGRFAARELEPAVAFDDVTTAGEIFQTLALDSDVRGLALYGTHGTLLAAAGDVDRDAPSPSSAEARIARDGATSRIVAPVRPREGGAGVFVLVLSARSIEIARYEMLVASGFAAAVALALCLVSAGLIGRSIRRRLARIAVVARRVADGDVSCLPPKDASGDEIGELARGFEIMLARIQQLMAEAAEKAAAEQQRLDELVKQRTGELDERNRNMRFLLDHLGEGVAVVDRDGRLADDHSRALELWFTLPTPGEPFWNLLPDPGLRSRLEAAWSGVVDDLLPLDLALDQLPSVFQVDGRQLRLRVDPVTEKDGTVTRFVVFFVDITAEIEQERVDMVAREMAAVLLGLSRDRAGFLGQMRDMDVLVAHTLAARGVDASFKRDLHTLKGNAGLLGFVQVAWICHELESAVEENDEVARRRILVRLEEAWKPLRAPIGDATSASETVEVSRVALADIATAAAAGVARPQLTRRLRELTFEPARRRLDRFAEWARAAASRQGKVDVDVVVDDGDLVLDPTVWGGFWSDYVHVVRNALGHGIEPTDERLACGKPARASLHIRCRRSADRLTFEVTDDGRGIDWERVRARAVGLGAPSTTREDLVEALFVEGLSTRAEADDLSGRGEGLSAFRLAAVRLGGSISVDTELGRGTTFRVEFPLASVAHAVAWSQPPPEHQERRSA